MSNTPDTTAIPTNVPAPVVAETKAAKFTRLAPPRVSKILDSIDNLSKLSGRGYEYTPEQIKAMFDAMGAELQKAYDAFQPKVETTDTAKSARFSF